MDARKKLAAIGLAVATVTSTGCYSTTKIYSQPSGAKVVMDNRASLGTTPLEVEESVWLWTSHSLSLSKEGYETATLVIRNEGLKFGYLAVCVCTGGLLLPIMFASSYPAQYVVEMKPTGMAQSGGAFAHRPNISFD